MSKSASEPSQSNVLGLFTRPAYQQDEPTQEQPTAEGKPSTAAEAAPANEKKKEVYKATLPSKSKREIRLKICYGDANVRIARRPAYSHLNDIVETDGKWLSLIYTNMVIVLKGRHLDKLAEDLHDEKVRAIICFRPGYHEEPDEDEPVIFEIQNKTLDEVMSVQSNTIAA